MQHSSSLLTPLSSSNRLHKPDLLLRSLAFTVVYATVIFLLNNFLNFWALWPGALNTLGGLPSAGPYAGFGWLQVLSYVSAPMLALLHVSRLQSESYQDLSNRVSNWAATTIKAAFWMVLLVGMVDMLVSFMRIESLLAPIFGDNITSQLGKPQFRGAYVHLPLMLLSCFIAIRSKGLGFIWLALLVVVAEFLIVITRFVFSYEQAFQGDIVRFWYAALFLFASAYTLFEDGHVRVDVIYTNFSRRTKGIINSYGCIFLGMTLCWAILLLGMWEKTNIIVNPMLSYESAQAGFGMYTKYWLASFLAIFAISMIVVTFSLISVVLFSLFQGS